MQKAQSTILFFPRMRARTAAACVVVVWLAVAQAAITDLRPQLVRNGFASVSGESVRGKHIVTGWTAGIPFSGYGNAGPILSPMDLYAMYWSMLQYADVPPAPDLTDPVPVLVGQTGSYETIGFTVTLIGTKSPYPLYGFHSWVLAATNGVPLPLEAVNQFEDGSVWNISLPLPTDGTMRVSLICSNTFGLSTKTTVLDIDQVPEPGVAVVAVLAVMAAFRRRTGGHRLPC